MAGRLSKKSALNKEIEDIAIPMYGRAMHDIEGNLTFQPYGQEGQAILSISRGDINCRMMDVAEQHSNMCIRYNEKCVGADLENGVVYLKNTLTGKRIGYSIGIVYAHFFYITKSLHRHFLLA